MGGVNRGKQFEEQVRKAFEAMPDTSVDRIPDQMTGFVGSSNVADFLIFRNPYLLYLECKSCYGNTLNFHNISDNQWKGLSNKSKIPFVKAGVLIWFIDHDKTIYVPIQVLEIMKEQGYKSFNILKDTGFNHCELEGIKRRVLFDYDVKYFWNWLKYNIVSREEEMSD